MRVEWSMCSRHLTATEKTWRVR